MKEVKVLVVNAGSSTYKCALFALTPDSSEMSTTPLWEGTAEFKQGEDPKKGIRSLLNTALEDPSKVLKSLSEVKVVGHRVVHGGEKFLDPVIVTPAVKEAIRSLEPLAPLHNPTNLQGIEIAQSLLPKAVQVAVFDTAFFKTLPPSAAIYPLPWAWKEEGIRRYGFHGISHEYCVKRAAALLKKELTSLKLISCHLGNGASLAAVAGGRCVDTTMGYTPLEGLMMGTRCGSIDPGILLARLNQKKTTAKKLDRILNFESGLTGIVGTEDMRKILQMEKEGQKRAHLALEMYVHSLVRNIGAMAAVLGGCDGLLFTGGIGENSSEIRQRVCERLSFLGCHLNVKKNAGHPLDAEIAQAGAPCAILVIHTRENLAIAQACAPFLPAKG